MEHEEQLRRRAVEGDREAFQELLQRYYRRLRRMVARRLEFAEAVGELFANELDPDDIINEAVHRALSKLHQLRRPHPSFWIWLSRLTLSILQREIRKAARRHRQEVSLYTPLSQGGGDPEAAPGEQLELIDVLPDPSSPIPEEVLLRREFLGILQRVVGGLPEKHRNAFFLHEIEGFTYREIANALNFSQKEVKDVVKRIRGLLREHLLQTGYFEEEEI